MQNRSAQRQVSPAHRCIGLIAGVMLSLGMQLLVALVGSIMISALWFRADSTQQIATAACLIGCFVGGILVCRIWGDRRLSAGVLTGMLSFGVMLSLAFLVGDVSLNGHSLAELAGCLIGGILAGICSASQKRRPKYIKRR